MIKTLVIFIVSANSHFTIDSKIDYLYFNIGHTNKDCMELVSEFRDNNTTYENIPQKRSNHILEDGSVFIGGTCL